MDDLNQADGECNGISNTQTSIPPPPSSTENANDSEWTPSCYIKQAYHLLGRHIQVGGKRRRIASDKEGDQEDSFQEQEPVVSEWLELEEELSEAQRCLADAREERKAAQREREEAREERLEAQKNRQNAQEERLKAEAERIRARNDRLNAKRERDEARKKRLQSQRQRQEARRERVQLEMELEEARNERRDTKAILGEVEETQSELNEITREVEEAQKEGEESRLEAKEILEEQMEERQENEEVLQEVQTLQNIKVERFLLEESLPIRDIHATTANFNAQPISVGIGPNELDVSTAFGICDPLEEQDQFDLQDQSTFEFRCPECGNGYIKRSSFMRHLKTHTEADKECRLCQKKFVRLDVLKRHLKNMHGETQLFDDLAVT